LIDVEQYWRDKEAALGEKVIAKFNCKYVGGYPDIAGPLSGLIFFSETTFCFQSFFSPGFLDSIVRFGNRLTAREEQFFCQALKNLAFGFEPADKNLWNKLFAPPEQRFVIRIADEKNPAGAVTCRFKAMRHDVKLIAKTVHNLKNRGHRIIEPTESLVASLEVGVGRSADSQNSA